MKIEPHLEQHITAMFSPISTVPGNSYPNMGALSAKLATLAPAKTVAVATHNMSDVDLGMFSTAAINMWMRAVHSFLISTSLTQVSPVWASVSGYYSSHYSVRALAHAMGFFHLFGAKRNVQISRHDDRFIATFRKKGGDREHHVYWTVVKANPQFASDPLFTTNESEHDPSDVRHRDLANYRDHLPQLPVFGPLDRHQIIERVQRIASIEVSAPPIPRADSYPYVESVQVVAYHRLVRFRSLLDEALGNGNRFWSVSRNPSWAREYLDYQIVEVDNTGLR